MVASIMMVVADIHPETTITAIMTNDDDVVTDHCITYLLQFFNVIETCEPNNKPRQSNNSVVNVFTVSKRHHYLNSSSYQLGVHLGMILYNTKRVATKVLGHLYGNASNSQVQQLK